MSTIQQCIDDNLAGWQALLFKAACDNNGIVDVMAEYEKAVARAKRKRGFSQKWADDVRKELLILVDTDK